MSFALSKSLNPSRVFLTRKAEMTGRWDPSYFRPELVALEEQVRSVTPSRLRDYVRRMAGGATPSTKEAETHYTESEDGVPFIRVQNLSTTGRLNLEDCKRITRSTHEGLLGRSKLSGGELLVKITGVGRMAVASVVPDNFEANINQHIVAIRTTDKRTSEMLAAWLNLDSAERLASRRSTGGTRPALDYPALLSMPIVCDANIPKLVNAAITRFDARVAKARQLLEVVYADVQALLGIHGAAASDNVRPNVIGKPTTFIARRSEISDRLDPEMVLFRRTTQEYAFPVCTLRSLLREPAQYGAGERGIERESQAQPRYVRITDIDEWAFLTDELGATATNVEDRYMLEGGDILLARSGNTVGKSYLHDESLSPSRCFFAGYLIRFRIKDEPALAGYVFAFTQLPVFRRWVKAVQRRAGQPM